MQETSVLHPPETVAIAGLSGGVDSSVAALLALRAGMRVIGVTLATPGAKPDEAAASCRELGIEHRVIEAREPFERCVVGEFVESWAHGLTPNPCVDCNPRVKFSLLVREADVLGGAAIITGHYARVARSGDEMHLLRATEATRDQSYMLHRLPQEVLARLILPLGELGKQQVRRLAAEAGLTAADREASQDVCFTPDVAELVRERRPEALQPGPIVDTRGRQVGVHRGLARYTVGQRRGLGIGGPDGPLFVLRIEPERNAVVVGREEALWVEEARVERVHAVGAFPGAVFEASVMTRYRGTETPASVEVEGERGRIHFHRPHRAPAPGQSAVFYDGERCLGGGVIVRMEFGTGVEQG